MTHLDEANLQHRDMKDDFKSFELIDQKIDAPENVKEMFAQFRIQPKIMEKMMLDFEKRMIDGLSDQDAVRKTSPLKMLPTYLHDTLHPSHIGVYPALDLGGTNLRFFRLSLEGTRYTYSSRSLKVPDSCLIGAAEDLFGFMAHMLKTELEKMQDISQYIPSIGFTFSFPLDQLSLTSGKLVCWTKGYNTSGVEGKDVAELMRIATKKEGLNIGEFILINDTAGTLLAGALNDTDCTIGVINGTGSNACYMESLENVPKWADKQTYLDDLIINIEWGAFGDFKCIDYVLTEYDKCLDKCSLRPGNQIFEKMISGMYLGEVARLVILDLVEKKLLFQGVLPESLSAKDSLDTRFLSNAYYVCDMVEEFKNDLQIVLTRDDAMILASLFDAIVYRAAQLTVCALAILIKRVNRIRVHIAVDGSMFKKNPAYLDYCNKLLKSIVQKDFRIFLTDDGSGRGAALAAAVRDAANTRHLELK